jgi:excisionase family DNA binding protein
MNPGEEKQILEEWLTTKELAPRLKSSPSGIYSLVRRESGIPHVRLSRGKILFNWKSVNEWLHELENQKRKRNFED